MTDRVRHGGCGCGAVRYEVHGEPIFVNNCHCIQCQHQTGSTSVVNAFYEAERLTFTSGALTEHFLKAGSGGPHIIVRCEACGTALVSYYPRAGRHGAGLRVGTLDEPGSLTPDAIIFASEALPWVAFPDGVPRFEKTYDFRDVLPPERVSRMLDLLGRT